LRAKRIKVRDPDFIILMGEMRIDNLTFNIGGTY
jgi:hypothetical protein